MSEQVTLNSFDKKKKNKNKNNTQITDQKEKNTQIISWTGDFAAELLGVFLDSIL